tara:strand:+ start:58271 stop:58864 length:594 start_codon:yes stop_codon:yes gene_type:complete
MNAYIETIMMAAGACDLAPDMQTEDGPEWSDYATEHKPEASIDLLSDRECLVEYVTCPTPYWVERIGDVEIFFISAAQLWQGFAKISDSISENQLGVLLNKHLICGKHVEKFWEPHQASHLPMFLRDMAGIINEGWLEMDKLKDWFLTMVEMVEEGSESCWLNLIEAFNEPEKYSETKYKHRIKGDGWVWENTWSTP